ncbi:MAG: hypothetical protein PHT32_05040, partial [Candidatus Omnitrophica bacterium]|nr:hypothetical protein [Candidatus Omnitrophota bacterium]
MEYSGYAGKERVDSALNYMRDATTVYSQTYYDYWDDGRLQQITEAVNMETSNPNSTHYNQKTRTVYRTDDKKGEERIDYIVSVYPTGGESYENMIGTAYYDYDELSYDLASVRHYDRNSNLISIARYRDLGGNDVVDEITRYMSDFTVESVTKYWYDVENFVMTGIAVWDSEDETTRILKSFTKYIGGEGEERISYVKTDITDSLGNDFTMTKAQEALAMDQGAFETTMVFDKLQKYIYNTGAYTVAEDAPLEKLLEYKSPNTDPSNPLHTPVRETIFKGIRDAEKRYEIFTREVDGTYAMREDYYFESNIDPVTGVYTSGTFMVRAGDPTIGIYDPLKRSDRYIYFTGIYTPTTTPWYKQAETYYFGYIDNERVSLVKSFNTDGTVKGTSRYFYRLYTEALERVEEYVGETNVLESVTYYEGPKGNEKIKTVRRFEVGSSGAYYDPTMNIWADVNQDGVVDEKDVTLLTNSITMIVDVDGNGIYDYSDIRALQTIIRALSTVNGNVANLSAAYNFDLDGNGTITQDEINKMKRVVDQFIDVDMNGQLDGSDVTAITNLISFMQGFDSDRDGDSDYDELQNGTDPTNPLDNSAMTVITLNNFFAALDHAVSLTGGYTTSIYGIPGLGVMQVSGNNTLTITLPGGQVGVLGGTDMANLLEYMNFRLNMPEGIGNVVEILYDYAQTVVIDPLDPSGSIINNINTFLTYLQGLVQTAQTDPNDPDYLKYEPLILMIMQNNGSILPITGETAGITAVTNYLTANYTTVANPYPAFIQTFFQDNGLNLSSGNVAFAGLLGEIATGSITPVSSAPLGLTPDVLYSLAGLFDVQIVGAGASFDTLISMLTGAYTSSASPSLSIGAQTGLHLADLISADEIPLSHIAAGVAKAYAQVIADIGTKNRAETIEQAFTDYCRGTMTDSALDAFLSERNASLSGDTEFKSLLKAAKDAINLINSADTADTAQAVRNLVSATDGLNNRYLMGAGLYLDWDSGGQLFHIEQVIPVPGVQDAYSIVVSGGDAATTELGTAYRKENIAVVFKTKCERDAQAQIASLITNGTIDIATFGAFIGDDIRTDLSGTQKKELEKSLGKLLLMVLESITRTEGVSNDQKNVVALIEKTVAGTQLTNAEKAWLIDGAGNVALNDITVRLGDYLAHQTTSHEAMHLKEFTTGEADNAANIAGELTAMLAGTAEGADARLGLYTVMMQAMLSNNSEYRRAAGKAVAMVMKELYASEGGAAYENSHELLNNIVAAINGRQEFRYELTTAFASFVNYLQTGTPENEIKDAASRASTQVRVEMQAVIPAEGAAQTAGVRRSEGLTSLTGTKPFYPVLAEIKYDNVNQLALITKVTVTAITYTVAGQTITETYAAFREKYQGRAIATKTMLAQAMGTGTTTTFAAANGSNVSFVMDQAGNVQGLMFDCANGDTITGVMTEIAANLYAKKNAYDIWLAELKRLLASAGTAKAKEAINAQIAQADDSLVNIKKLIEGLNKYRAETEGAYPDDETAAGDAQTLINSMNALKVEIQTAIQNVTGLSILALKDKITEAYGYYNQMYKLLGNVERINSRVTDYDIKTLVDSKRIGASALLAAAGELIDSLVTYTNGIKDSDGDGYSDTYEDAHHLNKKDWSDIPLTEAGDLITLQDQDGDGYSDSFEKANGTDWTNATDYTGSTHTKDTDNDGESDMLETRQGTAINDFFSNSRSDTDRDGVKDMDERSSGALIASLAAIAAGYTITPTGGYTTLQALIAGVTGASKQEIVAALINAIKTTDRTAGLLSVLMGRPINAGAYSTVSDFKTALIGITDALDTNLGKLIRGVSSDLSQEAFINGVIDCVLIDDTQSLLNQLFGETVDLTQYTSLETFRTVLLDKLDNRYPDLVAIVTAISMDQGMGAYMNELTAKLIPGSLADRYTANSVDLDQDGYFDWEDPDADGD